MWFLVAALGVVALIVVYALLTARRLDRLHSRIDTAAAALHGQLLRRSSVAEGFSSLASLPLDDAQGVYAAARTASSLHGLGHDREVVENALTRSLVRAVAGLPETGVEPLSAAVEMHDEALRATFARRFFNDTVRDALVVRDRRVVRWLRLAGRAPHPAYFEMADEELAVRQISVASAPTMEG